MKCVGDVEIYRPESENIIDTVNDHNDIIEEEMEGDIDIAKIEQDVDNKNRDQVIQMEGIRNDLPKCTINNINEVNEAFQNAKKDDKKARRRAKIANFVKRFYNELYP